MALSLTACSGDSNSTNPQVSIDDITNQASSTTVPTEQFEIQTSYNGLSVSADTYTFARAEEGAMFVNDFVISAVTDTSWRLCSGLNDRLTVLKAEDPNIVPEDALELDIVKNSDIVGASGSNEIDRLDIKVDRTKVKVGNTKIKLQVKPYNGSSSIAKLTTICVNVEIKEFGEIMVDTYDVTITADISKLSEKLNGVEEITQISLNISDKEAIYGYSADSLIKTEIPLEGPYTTIEIKTFKFAVGHTYNIWIVALAKTNTFLPVEASTRDDSKYKIEAGTNESTLEVFEDCEIEIEIDENNTILFSNIKMFNNYIL